MKTHYTGNEMQKRAFVEAGVIIKLGMDVHARQITGVPANRRPHAAATSSVHEGAAVRVGALDGRGRSDRAQLLRGRSDGRYVAPRTQRVE